MIHFKIKQEQTQGWEKGWGNGYVLIPKGHKYYQIDYNDIDVQVHGGLTYSKPITLDFLKRSDLTPEEIEKIDLDSWCIGFDTGHYMDNIRNCNENFVESECLRLKAQLETPKDLQTLIKEVLKDE